MPVLYQNNPKLEHFGAIIGDVQGLKELSKRIDMALADGQSPDDGDSSLQVVLVDSGEVYPKKPSPFIAKYRDLFALISCATIIFVAIISGVIIGTVILGLIKELLW